jgi:hypothetical protein
MTPSEKARRVVSVNHPPTEEAPRPQQWTEAERAYGRKLGTEAVRESARGRHSLWRRECISLIVGAFDNGGYIFRDGLIEGLRSFNVAYNIRGKCGQQVKRSTISKWLTPDTESAIRLEAIARLIARKAKP